MRLKLISLLSTIPAPNFTELKAFGTLERVLMFSDSMTVFGTRGEGGLASGDVRNDHSID